MAGGSTEYDLTIITNELRLAQDVHALIVIITGTHLVAGALESKQTNRIV